MEKAPRGPWLNSLFEGEESAADLLPSGGSDGALPVSTDHGERGGY